MRFILNIRLVYVFVFFGTIYSLISLVNHYCFRTYALDLGAYTNALYDYLHLQWNDSTVFKETPENLLADHFDLYLILFSPLSVLLKSYTLLIIQIIFILLGGYGVWLYFKEKKELAILLSAGFYLFFGIYAALSYDYHSNVVAAMLVPYFFLFIQHNKWSKSFLMLILICIGKENMALWMCFVILGLMIEHRKNAIKLKHLSVFLFFSVIYFLVVTQVVMPYFSNENKFYQFKYSVLGTDYTSAITHILTHPVDTLKTLFINHTNEIKGNYVKAELHIFILLSGLWALFFKPQYILMLIPVYFQKLFHDNYLMWGIDGQYSIEFAPILTIGTGKLIYSLNKPKLQFFLTLLFVILNLVCTIRLMDRTILFTNKSRIRIYQSSHYQRNFKLNDVYEAIKIIPDTATVSAQTSILPHLALRDKVYTFPIIKDAEYIVLNTLDDTYPLDTIAYKNLVLQMLQDTLQWNTIYHKNSVILLKHTRP